MTLLLFSWSLSPDCKCPVALKGFSYLDSAVIGGCRCEPLDLIALAGARVDDVHGALHLAPVQPVLGDFCSVARRALQGEGEILLSSGTYTPPALWGELCHSETLSESHRKGWKTPLRSSIPTFGNTGVET